MNLLDLCSGIGGFALGLQRAGIHPVAFAEISPYCRDVLARHWPDATIYGDINTLLEDDDNVREDLGRAAIGVISAGYPCQPFSLAGDRLGESDDRHLWPIIARIIRGIRPNWVLLENVPGHVTMGLDQVITDLEALGYTCEAILLPAVAIDAPHLRHRVWIIAHTYGERLEGIREARTCARAAARIVSRCQATGTLDANLRFEHWKSPEPGILIEDDGFPERLAHQAIGNAVCPLITEIFGHLIMDTEDFIHADTH